MLIDGDDPAAPSYEQASATQGYAMKRHTWIIAAVVGMLVWIGIGLGGAHAQVIPPVLLTAPFPPIASPSVTVSIFQGSTNVTGTWLPEPDQPVTLKVFVDNVEATATISLVAPINANPIVGSGSAASPSPTLTTSAYPGRCTNFDNAAALVAASPDFTLSGNVLTPTDCGGMAVIQVTGVAGGPFTFILPQDSDFDGLPDIWEAKYCPAGATQNTCLTATADDDPPPVILSVSLNGDGIAVFDEYRGFMVSGIPTRTHPQQKDLFAHLVNPQCGSPSLLTTYPTDETPAATLTLSATSGSSVTFTASTAVFNPSHLGGEIIAGTARATITAFVSTTAVTGPVTQSFASTSVASGSWTIRPSLVGNVNNLIPGTRIHLLGYTPGGTNGTTNEWVDRFFQYTVATGFEYKPTPDATPQTTAPADDRQINKNAVYPVLDTVIGNTIQRGVRITECLDESVSSPLGVAGRGSPNHDVEVLLFTTRIVNSMNNAISAGGTKLLKYSTYLNGAWQTPASLGAPSLSANNFLISRAMLFYLAMEVGHSVRLTPTVISTNKATYGYHYAPNSGDNLDQAIQTKVSSQANTFWIPSIFNTTGQGQFRAKN